MNSNEIVERGGVRNLPTRLRTNVPVPRGTEEGESELEDTVSEGNEGGDKTKPSGVTRGEDEKQDHHGCEEPGEAVKKRSTCPQLPKSLSIARDNVSFTHCSYSAALE